MVNVGAALVQPADTYGLRTRADIDAALAAGGTVRVASDVTIALSSPLMITKPTRLIGGSFTCATGPAIQVSSGNVEIDGVTITGGGQGSTYDSTQKLIYVLGAKAAQLGQIDIHNCNLSGSRGDNIWLEWVVNGRVHHNTITTYLYSGVMIISGDRIAIDNNNISDAIIATGNTDCYGIAVTDLTNLATDRSQHVTVTGNTVRLIDWEGIDTHGGNEVVVTGNVVISCVRGIAFVTGAAGRVASPTGCVATGNTVDATGARATIREGIWLSGLSGTPADGVITGNVIKGYATVFGGFTFYDRTLTYVGSNNVPWIDWTALPISGGAGYITNNTGFPAQYMIDGDTVSFRGGVIPPAGGIGSNPIVTTAMPAAAWPSARTFYAVVKGSGATAALGVWNIDTAGTLRIDYGSTTSDQLTYWCTGSYRTGH